MSTSQEHSIIGNDRFLCTDRETISLMSIIWKGENTLSNLLWMMNGVSLQISRQLLILRAELIILLMFQISHLTVSTTIQLLMSYSTANDSFSVFIMSQNRKKFLFSCIKFYLLLTIYFFSVGDDSFFLKSKGKKNSAYIHLMLLAYFIRYSFIWYSYIWYSFI